MSSTLPKIPKQSNLPPFSIPPHQHTLLHTHPTLSPPLPPYPLTPCAPPPDTRDLHRVQTLIAVQVSSLQPLTYNKTYVFPPWANLLGFALTAFVLAVIPLYAIAKLVLTQGDTIREVSCLPFTPSRTAVSHTIREVSCFPLRHRELLFFAPPEMSVVSLYALANCCFSHHQRVQLSPFTPSRTAISHTIREFSCPSLRHRQAGGHPGREHQRGQLSPF